MVEVKIHPLDKDNGQYLFVVIVTRYHDKWVWVKHRQRNTWEIPGGHIEQGETADDAAKRELYEETGASKFVIEAVCDYSVKTNTQYGVSRIYFADVEDFQNPPQSEIECKELFDDMPLNLTYPNIQPILFNKAKELKLIMK